MMFVPATPNSMLVKMMEEEVQNSNMKIKVVERPGMKVKRLLQKNDPYKGGECSDGNCFVCSTTKEGSCRKCGVTYAITCKGDCDEDMYNRETHGNAYTRGGD